MLSFKSNKKKGGGEGNMQYIKTMFGPGKSRENIREGKQRGKVGEKK